MTALDPVYLLPPDKFAALREKRHATHARFHRLSPEEVKAGAEQRMQIVDGLPPEWRALVHEHGLRKVMRWRRKGATPHLISLLIKELDP